jgi:molecular chaperone GrpE
MHEDDMNSETKPRHRTRAEERADAVTTPSRSQLAERIEALERELEEVRRSETEQRGNWQRSAADFANYRRRTEEERAAVAQFASSLVIGKLLSVVDDFDRALESVPPDLHDSWIEGIQLVERKLRGVLESEGVTPIEAIGQPFDPNVHVAVVH